MATVSKAHLDLLEKLASSLETEAGNLVNMPTSAPSGAADARATATAKTAGTSYQTAAANAASNTAPLFNQQAAAIRSYVEGTRKIQEQTERGVKKTEAVIPTMPTPKATAPKFVAGGVQHPDGTIDV
ncbi:hypothetical protein [Tsukamurella spumae]|uniref:PE domain-containing protein n=1 Tax=Tsukamurella spumae TaxID=44753 RepID=A0A846X284_9ACTN|nr:hypothetical protein [Tsukamurella spumae]NKY19727.1 hypothetical protein [Tsukamurella spumae]